MTSFTSGELTSIVIDLVIVLVVARRIYAMTQGVPISALRISVIPVVLLAVFLWGSTEFESVVLIPWALPYLIVVDLAILVASVLLMTPIAARMTEVTLDDTGGGTFRIGVPLGALFLVTFVIRLGLTIALFPSALAFGAPPGGAPPVSQQEVLAVVDALLSFSMGLLVARSAGVRRKVVSVRAAGPH